MSIAAQTWAKSQTVGNATAKSVLRAIAEYADPDGVAWPSQAKLAAELEITERSVRNALDHLERGGFIERKKRPPKDDGTRVTDVIRLCISTADIGKKPEETLSTQPPETLSTTGNSFQDHRNLFPKPPERGSGKLPEELPVELSSAAACAIPPADGMWTRRHYDRLEALLTDAAGDAMNAASPSVRDVGPAVRWIGQGCDLFADVLPVIRDQCSRGRPGRLRSFAVFEPDVLAARNRRLNPSEPRHEPSRQPPRQQPQSGADKLLAAIAGRAGARHRDGRDLEEGPDDQAPIERHGAVLDLRAVG